MWAASIKQSLTIRGQGWSFGCLRLAAAVQLQSTQSSCSPAPALPAAVPGWWKLLGSSLWNSAACTCVREREKDGTPRAAGHLRNMGQQLWQPAGSEMPLFMPHHGNQLLPPQQLLSAVGLPPSPGVGIEDCFMLEAWYRDDKVLGDIDNHLWWGLVGGTDCNATQAMASSLGRLFYSLICKQTAQISFTISHLLQYRQKSQQMKWISPWKALNYIITVENTGGRR